MQTETKLKHLAIVVDSLDSSLEAAVVEFAAQCGLETLDFYGVVPRHSTKLLSKNVECRGTTLVVNLIDNSAVQPARSRLESKIAALPPDLDYESFVEALVPSAPDLIILQGASSLRGRVLEEAAYAEIVFVDKSMLELSDIKLAFEDFARRKRNFGV